MRQLRVVLPQPPPDLARRHAHHGWPAIKYGMNYDGTPVTDRTGQVGMEQPLVQSTPSIAVRALEFYTGDRLPRWKHELFTSRTP